MEPTRGVFALIACAPGVTDYIADTNHKRGQMQNIQAAAIVDRAADVIEAAIERYNGEIADAWLAFQAAAESAGIDLTDEIEAWETIRSPADALSEDLDADLTELEDVPEYSSNEPEPIEFDRAEVDCWLDAVLA